MTFVFLRTPFKRLAAIACPVVLLSVCGGQAALDSRATATYVDDFVFQKTGFRPFDVRCPTGVRPRPAVGSTATSRARRGRTRPTCAS